MTAPAPPGPPAGGHRPEIDGLRALAIVPVVVHHAAPALLPGGFAGVDIFFVISGYLITAIILRELAEGRFTLLAFWERRARRIVPALAAMLIATLAAAWAVMTPEDFARFAKALVAASVFASNVHFAGGTGYFDGVEGALPLLHTWTLGVEEQFYLLFPLMVLAAWRWRRAAVLPMIATAGLASLALALLLAVWLAPRMPLAAFYLLPTRMWELMLGALCAALPRAPRANGRLAAGGVALVATGFAVIGPATPAPGPAFLLPTLGTALVLLFACGETRTGRALAWPPLAGLGLISFGLYLWHQPVLALAGYVHFGPLPPLVLVAAIALALALAAASWRWIEQPVRHRRMLERPALLAGVCAAALAVPLAAGALGFARVLLPASAAEAQLLGALRPAGADNTVIVPASGRPAFVLYGDSHSGQYLAAAEARLGTGALLSEAGCLAADGITNWHPATAKGRTCTAQVRKLIELIRERRISTLIWAQRWDRDLLDAASGAALGASSGSGEAALRAGLLRTIDRLPPGTRVILIGNAPTSAAGGAAVAQGWLRCRAWRNTACPESYPATLAEGRKVSAMLRALAASDPRITYVDAAAPLCPDGRCLLMQEGRLNHWDANHLASHAAARVIAAIPRAPILP
ncbi:acyltransferase family protein [Porphyrobacter sp. AAP82]|uniref:acyltransferase family protein n=1 Tax=Porphyrobacter sp. AAP82 TaxID=1248917 RepID=UPI0002D83133|nr:acyltransferase family protein [Porphyrobacter sp. AAP82]